MDRSYTSTPLAKSLGQMIAGLRKKHGISKSELAAYTGISRSHIHSLEGGKRQITLNKLESIAEVFGIPPSKLLKDAEKLMKG